ncbi:MAG TPA: rhodanese-like domain-containing protein [Rubrivivax sp.]|nr:rhodanese-like domain-containing protein [Rubrivivax sp.]
MQKRTWIQWAFAAALGLAAAAPALAADTPSSVPGVKVVSAEEVKQMLDAGVPVIDTRVAAEYVEKTIKGARSVPYKEKSAKEPGFDAAQDQFDLAKLPSDKSAPLVFFCNGGECWKSYKASVVAHKAGYTKINWFRGGFPEWTSKGLPTQ